MHRYQSRFMYQLNPLGDYYSRGYTLGSLSNKPGRDWSTPRYVRDEPDRFMAGYGQDEGEGEGGGDNVYEPDEGTITVGGKVVEPGEKPDIATEMEAHREIMEVPKTTTAEDLQYYLDEALKYGKTAVSIGGKVFSAYQSAKQIYDQVTGAGSAGGGVAPIPPVIDPTTPIPVAPIPVVDQKGVRRVTDAQVQATLYHRGLLPASQLSPAARKMVGLPPLTTTMDSKKMLLLVGAAAAVYFLAIRK